MEQTQTKNKRGKAARTFLGIVVLVGIIVAIALSSRLAEKVGADEIVVIQDPIDGDLHFYFQPGLYYQNLGTPTHYKKESQYWFSAHEDQGSKTDQSIKVRFNDGGHAKISGSVRWTLPMDIPSMTKIHTLFGSQVAVEQQLIRTVIEKSVYMTGPLMSSKESYAERRNDLISFIDDQASYGVYKTVTQDVKGIDALSGKEKTVTVVEPLMDTVTGKYFRQEVSPIGMYKIGLYNFSINKVLYDKLVEDQIATQQKAIMDVQTSIAETKKAEQNAIKAEQEGKAAAATAKWKQEAVKAKEITLAEQKKEVARLAMEEATFYKQEKILRGEGEAKYKKLIITADGALKQKLETYVTVHANYAKAISEYKGDWVSKTSINYGGAGAGTKNVGAGAGFLGTQNLINLMMVKYADDLSLDMSIKKN